MPSKRGFQQRSCCFCCPCCFCCRRWLGMVWQERRRCLRRRCPKQNTAGVCCDIHFCKCGSCWPLRLSEENRSPTTAASAADAAAACTCSCIATIQRQRMLGLLRLSAPGTRPFRAKLLRCRSTTTTSCCCCCCCRTTPPLPSLPSA